MISNKTLILLAKNVIIILAALSFCIMLYFGNGLIRAYDFKAGLDKMYDFFSLISNAHKERAMQTLFAFEDDIDESNLELMKNSTDKALKKLELKKDFYDKLNKQRDGFSNDISTEALLEFFKPLDEYFLNYIGAVRLKNVNTELNGLLVGIWQAAHDNIRQNQIREFLLRFCNKKRGLNEDELQMLDDLYFDYTQYPVAITLNDTYSSYATFNNVDTDKINKILKEKMIPLWENIQQFYDVIHYTLLDGETKISFAKLLELCKRIEAQNTEIAKYLIDTTKSEFYKSITMMWIYVLVAFAMFSYCIFMLFSIRDKKEEILKDMNIKTQYLEKLKLIAKRREIKIDDKKIEELFTKMLDVINDADLIELKNKNEYSYFMNNISHEIINPLNNIYGYTQLLESSKDTNTEERTQHIKEISKSAKALKKLFENLLRVASIQSNSEENQPIELYAFEVLSSVLEETTIKAKEKRQKFEAYIDPRLEGIIAFDIKKVKFILQTLLDNAIKYNRPRGKVFLNIHIEHIKDKVAKIQIIVADKGFGYKEKNIEQNFLDTGDTKVKIYHKKGLNLAIANEYLRQMGSTLYVKSGETGSKFNYEISHNFISKSDLKDKFKGEKIYLYADKEDEKENSLPVLEGSKIPNIIGIMREYLEYLGFEVEFSKEEGKSIYVLFEDIEPFKMEKCIYCVDFEPEFVQNNKIYLPRAFCLQALVNAYESVMQMQEDTPNKLPIKALVLGNEAIANKLNSIVEEVNISIEPHVKYDIAFVDTDTMASEVKNIPQPCRIVALSYEGNTPMDANVTYGGFIIKSKDDDKKDYSKDIEKILDDFKAQKMLSNKKLHDVLLFKKSVASNNIYKNAILGFASSVDIANDVRELELFLETHPYKIVLCDYDVAGLTLDKYQKLIQDARTAHRCEIVAGVFVPKDVHIYAKFFEEIPANLSKSELEMRIKKYLVGIR